MSLFGSSTPPTLSVTCPECGFSQKEPEGVVSTKCRECQTYIRVKQDRSKPVSRLPRQTRRVVCNACSVEHDVVPEAMSTQCPGCSTYINLRDYEVQGVMGETIQTCGVVHFLRESHYRGPEVIARAVDVHGRVDAPISAIDFIRLHEGADVRSRLKAAKIEVLERATARIARIHTPVLTVRGLVHTQEVIATESLVVGSGGALFAARIQARELVVEKGGSLEADFEAMP
jgi:cytoskeletal protein CcmA (bactofilin family)